MARSLATAFTTFALAFALLRALLGSEGLELAVELVDARLHRARSAVAVPEDERADDAQQDGDELVEEVAHRTSSTSATGAAPVPQSSRAPLDHRSRFQIGATALSVSMQKRAAANASSRWGVLTATTTAAS